MLSLLRRLQPRSVCRGVRAQSSALLPEQWQRVLPPAFWRWEHLTKEDLGGPRAVLADRLAGLLVEKLCTAEEKAELRKSAPAGGTLDAEIAGTHGAFIDRMVLDAAGRRVRQVLFVGSGLDSRAFRLDLQPQLRYFELEEPKVLDCKVGILGASNHRPRCQTVPLPAPEALFNSASSADALGEALGQALASALNPQQPSLILVGDGSLGRVWAHEEKAERVLGALAKCAGENSRLVVPVHCSLPSESGISDSVTAWRAALAATGWGRVDVVGHAALSRLLSRAPPDEAAVLVIAERGAGQQSSGPPTRGLKPREAAL